MTTSEQARAWAKAEAEKLPAGTPPTNAAEWGILHVLSLLESEAAVEAFADKMPLLNPVRRSEMARICLAAAVEAILASGDVTQSANTNQEPGGSENG